MFLPPELMEGVLANLEYDSPSLIACALASRQFAHARVLLFRHVRLDTNHVPSRLLRVLTDSPHLIQLIAHIEITAVAVRDEALAALCFLLSGPLDEFGRHPGAGSLRSVTLIAIRWHDVHADAHRALLALISCSSVSTITLHVNVAFLAAYLAYVSPNLRALHLYNCMISPQRPSHRGLPSPTISTPIRPAQITSLDLMGSTIAALAAKHTCPFTFSNALHTLRIFIEPHFQWNHYLSLFEHATGHSAPLHTLSLILADYGTAYHHRFGYLSPPLSGWLGFDLSNPPFHNLHTLNIYADTRDDALPVCYSLFSWIAATIGKLSPQNRRFESVVVYLKIRKDSKLAKLGSLEDWDRLLVAMNRIETLARLTFVVKIKPRDDLEVETIYREFVRLVRARLMMHGKAIITVKKDRVVWPPRDVYTRRVWVKHPPRPGPMQARGGCLRRSSRPF